MDYGSRVADKAIAKTAKQIHAVYLKAGKDLKKKLASFYARKEAKQREMLALVEAGKITKTEYGRWLSGQIFIGKQWEQKVDQAVRIMNDANREAMLLISANRLDVFAENYNFAAYQLERQARGVVSFNLFNDRSVARLMKEKPKMLPEWKIDQPKDYKWNRQRVENSITQGIIQGEPIDKITDRLVDTLCTQNENRMRLFARTGMTGAQNAGRQELMEEAEEDGIKVKKRWVATLDDRTRDTHQILDGQEVPVSEPFEVEGMEIMFPGDPHAEPELVYNCRCTMIEVYEGVTRKSTRRAYDTVDGVRDTKHSYLVEDMTYKEWKEWKERGKH